MNEDVIMLILEFVLRLFVIVAVPFGYKLIRQYNLEKAVKDGVWAAEQLFKQVDPDGSKRREFVQKYVLDRYKVEEEKLQVLIEAFVKELNLLQIQP